MGRVPEGGGRPGGRAACTLALHNRASAALPDGMHKGQGLQNCGCAGRDPQAPAALPVHLPHQSPVPCTERK